MFSKDVWLCILEFVTNDIKTLCMCRLVSRDFYYILERLGSREMMQYYRKKKMKIYAPFSQIKIPKYVHVISMTSGTVIALNYYNNCSNIYSYLKKQQECINNLIEENNTLYCPLYRDTDTIMFQAKHTNTKCLVKIIVKQPVT